jgi:hypothetical protein
MVAVQQLQLEGTPVPAVRVGEDQQRHGRTAFAMSDFAATDFPLPI